jgi:uncharacterized membrane protein
MESAIIYAASVRWLHILAGITWIGLLYYFNFVQATAFAQAPQDATSRQKNFVTLVPRALLFFRWAAMVTFLAGLLLFLSYGNPGGIIAGYNQSSRGLTILVGALMGTLMMINVWGIIWPNQKRIIAANQTQLDGGQAPADMPKWARRAFLASRFNTMLSIPMLFFMVAAPFLPGFAH